MQQQKQHKFNPSYYIMCGFVDTRSLPFFFRSTVMLWPSSLRQIIFGDGNPSALKVQSCKYKHYALKELRNKKKET